MGKKKTDSEYDAELAAAGGEYVRLAPYMGASTKVLHRHVVCNHEWPVSPSTLLSRPGTCPVCGVAAHTQSVAKRKVTEAEYDKRIAGEYLRLAPYINYQTKILHRHLKCGHEWEVPPTTLAHRMGTCEVCSNERLRQDRRLSDAEYDQRIAGEYIRLAPYVNTQTKILHRHLKCNREWRVKPSHLMENMGMCPTCSKYGFDPSGEGNLYLLNINGICIKYGIASDMDARIKTLYNAGGTGITLIRSWQLNSGAHARDVERMVKLKFGGGWAPPELLPNGWTETLDSALLPSVIAFIEDAVKNPE